MRVDYRDVAAVCPRGRGAAAFAGFGWLHLEGVVEAVEVVEEADGAEQLDDFAFGVEAAQLGELLVGDGVGVAGDGFGETQGSLFGRGEVIALGPIGKVRKLVVGPAEDSGEDGVAGEAIGGFVHLAGADDDQLFEFGGDGAGIEDRGEMCLHGGEDFGTVGHDAKHVGHVAAQGKCLVVQGGQFGGYFAAVEAGNAGHAGLLGRLYSWYRLAVFIVGWRVFGRGPTF